MGFKERQELRITLLKELYELYFSNNSLNAKVIDIDKLKKEDNEKALAYEYLRAKNLISDVSVGGNNAKYIISVYGIDVVESLELKK